MEVKEIIIALTIHLVIPLLGLIYFISVVRRMDRENVPDQPVAELFIIFSTYGGLLLVVLTALFWKWSGMASLGLFYLLLIAPVIMGVISYRHRATKGTSKYHRLTYNLGLLYFFIAPMILLILF
jgi:hypothetical protein